MAVEYFLGLYLLCHLGLLAWSFRFQDSGWRLWFLRLMLLGTSYDNSVLLLSSIGLGSEWYHLANVPRFFVHAAVLPFLTLFALSAMQIGGVVLARRRFFISACVLFTGVCWAYGVWHEVLLLELEETGFWNHRRLTSASELPPIATIATNLVILPMALALWRVAGWPWFFAGALFIFLLNGAGGAQPWGFLAGNAAEVVFIASLLTTERFLQQRG